MGLRKKKLVHVRMSQVFAINGLFEAGRLMFQKKKQHFLNVLALFELLQMMRMDPYLVDTYYCSGYLPYRSFGYCVITIDCCG